MKTTDEPIIVEQTYQASIRRVWDAITRLEEMQQWFFVNIGSFSPEPGFQTQFVVVIEDRTFTHLWKLTEVIPFQKLTYNWKYQEYPGDSFVTFQVMEAGSHIKLRLTHKVIESFPDGIPEFTRESGLAGWNYFIGESLKKYLEANPS